MALSQAVRPVLMLVTDRRRAGDSLLRAIDTAVASGVDVIQIREKDLPQAELLTLAYQIVSVVDGRAKVVVSSAFNVALELGIGLHLPESALPLSDDLVRQLDPNVLIGRSIHSEATVAEERVDYLLYGHVFATSSKPDLRPRGLDGLAEAVGQSEKPVWAIGGITVGNAFSAIERGARGIAVIGAILDASDPRAATLALRAEIDRAVGSLFKVTRT